MKHTKIPLHLCRNVTKAFSRQFSETHAKYSRSELDTIEQWHPECNWTSYSAANMFKAETFTHHHSIHPFSGAVAYGRWILYPFEWCNASCERNTHTHTNTFEKSKPSSINHKQNAWHALLPFRFRSNSNGSSPFFAVTHDWRLTKPAPCESNERYR